jgi:hypothetical protein
MGELYALSPFNPISIVKSVLGGGVFSSGHRWGILGGHQGLAKEILKNEKQLDKRALLLDADIAEITRKIGLETVQQIYESILEEHIALKKKKKN